MAVRGIAALWCGLAVFAAATGVARTSSAQTADPTAAETLFDEGKKLMAEGRYPEACGKFEESQRLDPGGGTLLHLALCREAEGKTASAWTAFHAAISQARRDKREDRERVAREHIEALEAKLAKLTITVKGDRPGLEVKRDGVLVDKAQWGAAVPIDPGKHTVEASIRGRRVMQEDVAIEPGRRDAVVTVQPYVAAPTVTPPATPPADSSSRSFMSGWRWAGLGMAGLGLAGIAVGSAFGVNAISKKNQSAPHCPNDFCDATGHTLRREGLTSGDVSTATFIAGGVLLAGGVVLVVAGPRNKATAQVAVGLGSLTLGGGF